MLERFLSDKQVEGRYVDWGKLFGEAVSYLHVGECHGFECMLAMWEKWEAEYARRGYKTLPLDDFILAGGYSKPLNNIGVKRDKDEKAIFYSRYYRDDNSLNDDKGKI